MYFSEKNIYNIIANYIPVSDVSEFILTDTTNKNNQLYLSENKNCSNGELTVFSFCKLYGVNTDLIDGSIFRYHVRIIQIFIQRHLRTDSRYKHPNNIYSYYDPVIESIIEFMSKIRTDNPDINIDIAHTLCDIMSFYSNICPDKQINLNLTQMLYQKVIRETRSDVYAHNYSLYNVYENYHLLNFVDINVCWSKNLNKYLTISDIKKMDDYMNNLDKDGSFYGFRQRAPYSYEMINLLHDPTTTKLEQADKICIENVKKISEFCAANNPFYKIIEGKTHMIVREDEFHRRFSKYTDDICSKFNIGKYGTWDNFVVAGGSIFNCLNDYPDQDAGVLEKGDIDIFFFGHKEDQVEAFGHIMSVIKEYGIIEEIAEMSSNSVEIVCQNLRKIQLILTDYMTPYEILANFDLWTSSVVYDGKNILGNLEFLYCVKFWQEKVDNRELKLKSILRVGKYIEKGMRLYVTYKPSKNNTSNSIYYDYNFLHLGLPINKCIEMTIMKEHGDITFNKGRVPMPDDFIDKWCPKFAILNKKDIAWGENSVVILDNSCESINSLILSRCYELKQAIIKADEKADKIKESEKPKLVKAVDDYYAFCQEKNATVPKKPALKKRRQDIDDDSDEEKYMDPNDAMVIDCIIRKFNKPMHVMCVVDENFNNIDLLLHMLRTYNHIIQKTTIKLFLDGTFTCNYSSEDDWRYYLKQIQIWNFNKKQAKILELIVSRNVRATTSNIKFEPDMISITSKTEKFAPTEGRLCVEYTLDQRISYCDYEGGVNVIGIFVDDHKN